MFSIFWMIGIRKVQNRKSVTIGLIAQKFSHGFRKIFIFWGNFKILAVV